jgi:hypothetical protein
MANFLLKILPTTFLKLCGADIAGKLTFLFLPIEGKNIS